MNRSAYTAPVRVVYASGVKERARFEKDAVTSLRRLAVSGLVPLAPDAVDVASEFDATVPGGIVFASAAYDSATGEYVLTLFTHGTGDVFMRM